MANFKTHLLIAAAVSGMASVAIIATDMTSAVEIGRYFPLGVAGGLLPDIDSDNSVPTKIFFSLLALCGAFLMVLWGLSSYSFAELAVIWAVVFIFIRYIVFEAFVRLTIHRGVFHSFLAGVFFSLLTVNISYYLFEDSTFVSWMSGCFIGMGYFIHLCLDEICSVDLMNDRLKKSFGSALKLISVNSIKASLLMMLLTITLYATCPDANPFWIKVTTTVNEYSAQNKWLPKRNQWFTGLPERLLSCASS